MEPETRLEKKEPIAGTLAIGRHGGGEWVSSFNSDVSEVSFVDLDGTSRSILKRTIPPEFDRQGQIGARIMARMYEPYFGYFPQVIPTTSGDEAWVWDVFRSELSKISDSEVLVTVSLGKLGAGRGVKEARIRGGSKIALILGLFSFDDYGDELMVSIALDGTGNPHVKEFQDRWWHDQSPDLDVYSADFLWGDQ